MKKDKTELYFLFALILTISFMHSRKIREKELLMKNISEKNSHQINSSANRQMHIISVSYK
jgi:hypothetical protein